MHRRTSCEPGPRFLITNTVRGRAPNRKRAVGQEGRGGRGEGEGEVGAGDVALILERVGGVEFGSASRLRRMTRRWRRTCRWRCESAASQRQCDVSPRCPWLVGAAAAEELRISPDRAAEEGALGWMEGPRVSRINDVTGQCPKQISPVLLACVGQERPLPAKNWSARVEKQRSPGSRREASRRESNASHGS